MKIQMIILCNLFLGLSLSAAQKTSFEENCTTAYRTATLDLLAQINQFKDKRITMKDLGVQTAQSKIYLKGLYLSCQVAASPKAVECMVKYKNVFDPLSQKINSLASVIGNQQDVDSGFFDVVSVNLKLGYIDFSCYDQKNESY